jgi:hypothetical protein
MSGAGPVIGLRTIEVYYINSGFMNETFPFEPQSFQPRGIRLGVVRGISYGLFGPPGEFVPQARALGAGLVRAYLYWSQVEPEPGQYRWDTVDALLGQLTGDEELWITLCSSSPWGTRQPTDFLPPSPALDQRAYAEFARQVVRHCVDQAGEGRVEKMAGARAVSRVTADGPPGPRAFEVDRPGRGPLLVVWDHRDPFDGEDEPPADLSWPWPADAATVTDVFGRTLAISGQDAHIRLPVSDTPLFVEPRLNDSPSSQAR